MDKKTIENGWSMLMKFGSEENLKRLQKGQLYMKNLQYYVDLEKATDDEDVGDKYDAKGKSGMAAQLRAIAAEL